VTYLVSTVVEGALDYEETFPTADTAYAEADRQAADCERGGVAFEVYVLEGDVQWATDHHPYRSGGS
jgi:hypothetical protein